MGLKKNPAAVALGKLAADKPKENLSKSDRAKRGQRGRVALLRWHREQGHDIDPLLAKAV